LKNDIYSEFKTLTPNQIEDAHENYGTAFEAIFDELQRPLIAENLKFMFAELQYRIHHFPNIPANTLKVLNDQSNLIIRTQMKIFNLTPNEKIEHSENYKNHKQESTNPITAVVPYVD
jgi:hypothetical protein